MRCEWQLTRIFEIVVVVRLAFVFTCFGQNAATYLSALLRDEYHITFFIAFMDGPPSLTQRPYSFHPDFDCKVYMVVFSVSNLQVHLPYHYSGANVSSRLRVKVLRSMQAN